jgi:hypothetical protein
MAQPFIAIVQAEDPVDYTDAAGVTWRRTGYCCHCGACCQADVDTGAAGACHYLATDANGVLQCTGRASAAYLNGCNVWPSVPEHIADKPACTYVFTRVS